MELQHDLSLTELIPNPGYQVIAHYHGHELIYYNQYGSYQGEWLLVTFDPISKEYYIWKGWYGSCSGCDSHQAEFSWTEIGYTRKSLKAWVEDYDPFLVVPTDTMKNIVKGGTSRVKEIIPANTRDWYDTSIDELADVIHLSCKLHGQFGVTTDDILNAQNVELRQMGLERFGYENFIEKANATVIDEWNDNELLAVGQIRLLYLLDPSKNGTRYLLPVPDNMERVKQALAWSFNLSEHEYNPVKET